MIPHLVLAQRWNDYYVQATRLQLYIEKRYDRIAIVMQRGICRKLLELYFAELESFIDQEPMAWQPKPLKKA